MLKFWYGLYRWSEKSDYKMIQGLGILALVLGIGIYYWVYGLPFLESVIYTIQLFAMDVKTPFELKDFLVELNGTDALCDLQGTLNTTREGASSWRLIYVAAFFATMTLVVGIISIFIKNKSENFYLKKIIAKGTHTIVVGLGKNSRFFVNSMLKSQEHQMVVYEKEGTNPYLDDYRKQPIALVEKDVERDLKNLNISKAKNIFISTGNDEINIYLAMKFMAEVENKEHEIDKLVVHIEDRTLRNLYDDDKALHKESIDLRPFSFYKEASRMLFKEHPLEGTDHRIMNSKEDFHIIVVGNSEFSIALIAEACKLSALPNENKLHIHCIGKEKEVFEKRVLYAFPQITKIEHVMLDYIEQDSKNIDFYTHKVWKNDNITHVIYADESALENVRIATKISDITYLKKDEKHKDIKFHIATMNNVKIAKEIRKELKSKRVFTCAEADKICSQENLFSNQSDRLGSFIHYSYESAHFRENGLTINNNIVEREWRGASVNDKRTSVAQAIHINTKLKFLGLKIEESNGLLTKEELCKKNKNIITLKLQKDMEYLGLDKNKILAMEKAYKDRESMNEGHFFPIDYTTKLEKLLNMEHNRWITSLILMDNTHNASAKDMSREQRKKLKIHHLLKPFSDFKTNEEKIYVINDLNSIRNIGLYMALIGYEIVAF